VDEGGTVLFGETTAETMSEHIDLDCSGLLRREYDLPGVGRPPPLGGGPDHQRPPDLRGGHGTP